MLWKSWNEANNLIKEGSSWKVGNGCNIKVWEDNWLTKCQEKKPFSPKPKGCTIQKVKNLLNREDGGWNKALIKGIFSEAETKAILRIPVSSMDLKDRLIWNSTTFG